MKCDNCGGNEYRNVRTIYETNETLCRGCYLDRQSKSPEEWYERERNVEIIESLLKEKQDLNIGVIGLKKENVYLEHRLGIIKAHRDELLEEVRKK